MQEKRVTVHYSGMVQGVNFRNTVKSLTMGRRVTGTIRNLSDGRVEMVAEGEEREMEALLKDIRNSNLGRLVEKEDTHWETASGAFHDFQVIA